MLFRSICQIDVAPALAWEKVRGNYGVAYRFGNYEVERVDAGFVAVRNLSGKLLAHYKTVKEAKAVVALATKQPPAEPGGISRQKG